MTVNAARQNEIGLELLRLPMRSYRAAPLFYPTFSAAFALLLDSRFSAPVIFLWWFALAALSIEYAIFQHRFFNAPPSIDADLWTRRCAARYWFMNALWVAAIPLFWQPGNEVQDLGLILVHTIHVVTTSITASPRRELYLSATLPSALMASLACFVEATPLFIALGVGIALATVYLARIAATQRRYTEDALRLRFDNGELIHDLAAARDASEAARLHAEEANAELARREELFRVLVENAFDSIVITDADYIITYATPSARAIGFRPEQMIGRSVVSFLPPEEARRIGELIGDVPDRERREKKFEFFTTGTAGRIHWYECSMTDLRADPIVNGLVINLRDITARKRSEAELLNQFQVLKVLATGAPIDEIMTLLAKGVEETNPGMRAAVYLINRERELTTAAMPSFPSSFTRAIEHFWQSNKDRAFGATVAAANERLIIPDLLKVDDASVRAFAAEYGVRALWLQNILTREGRGGIGAIAVYLTEPREPTERESAYLVGAAHLAGIAVDRRRAEEELREAMETAELASRAKSKFLANMSHELRTPLNAIIGFSEIMRDGLFGPLGSARYTEYAKDIHDSGTHLLNVIDDILDISKIEAGRYPLEEQEIDLGEVLRWSIEIVRPRTAEKQQAVRLAIPDDMPMLYADLRAMRQIMLNLLSNASKFTPEKGRIDVSTHVSGSGELQISVSDTGIGIPSEKLDEVMEPFGQVDDSSSRHHGGTGLGLPITKSLTEMHGGTFRLESELGRGTTATLTLPSSRLHRRPMNAAAHA
jgi:PAS domain S-box-containing protein